MLADVSRSLPRFNTYHEKAADQRKLTKILAEATDEAAPPKRVAGARSGGDEKALRGLPAIGRGVSGVIPGTSPLHAVIHNEMRVSKPRRNR